MVKVKICGIKRIEDLEAAVEAGADMVGLVVGVPFSPRNLDLHDAEHLVSMTPSYVKSIAVTVLNDAGSLNSILGLETDYVQLHGDPVMLMKLAGKEDLLRKKAIGVLNAGLSNVLGLSIEYSRIFSIILIDSLTENYSGGSGRLHDWELSRKVRDAVYPKPLILAGGLTPENVCMAVSKVKPYAVDVSTGVEVRPGVKDPEKIFKFIMEARRAVA
ncbi:MAG: phosphoribosylanthranilate isomerase [Thermoproteota archaeon]